MRFRPLLYVLAAAVPGLLLFSAARVFGALEDQKIIYLRSRVAALAAHLETMADLSDAAALLSEEEPALVGIQTFEHGAGPGLGRMWNGEELFRTEIAGGVFRAYIPFHREGEMRIAQIDLEAGAADFLLAHARHHFYVAFVSAFALAGLSVYAVWASQRAAAMRQKELRLQHLAHLGEMAAGLAHEIRNPLGTIKGFAQLLAESATAAQRPLIEPIVNESVRLEALVQDLLRYGRPPQPAPRDVEWQAVEDALAVHAGASMVRSERQLTLHTDPNLLEQALLNLVRNGIEAAGSVRLEVESSAGQVRISVLDEGPGLPPAIREHLFEPFYTTKALGTGLGLSISRKLVESLGGELVLLDRDPKGTEARVMLPDRGE